jgi:hypothetical protein
MMNGPGKSDRPEVPAKSPNNAGQSATEGMEGRGPAKGNLPQQNASRTRPPIGMKAAPLGFIDSKRVARNFRRSEIGVFDSCRACLPHVKESLPDIGRRHLRESSGLEGL